MALRHVVGNIQGTSMPQRGPAGTRIRAYRLDRGIAQAELARMVGISASYLGLIEAGKRRIAGRVLDDLCGALGVDPAIVTAAPDARAIAALDAAARSTGIAAEGTAGFAFRHPGWAAVIRAQARAVDAARRDADRARDRLAHDPVLSAALHQVISTATAIQSSAAILVGEEADPDWQARFLANVDADARRLAQASRTLAARMERAGRDAVDDDAGPDPRRTAADAAAIPLAALVAAVGVHGLDPVALARHLDAGLATTMRRLADLPASPGRPAMGLASCDGSGTLVARRPVLDTAPARSGACPLWPLYAALGQPGRPLRRVVAMPGDGAPRLTCYAVAEWTGDWDAQHLHATMLMVADAPTADPAPVGPGCAVCPRPDCDARRHGG